MTLDGKIAAATGESRWITGEAARRRAHELRRETDAIVVGIGTALADDPELTVRVPGGWPREPLRVVLDSGARLAATARLLGAGTPARAVVAVTAAGEAGAGVLASRGATVLRCRDTAGRVDLRDLLARLWDLDARAVLVEGGGEVHGAFLDAGLVDRVVAFVAPIMLGGRTAPSPLAGVGRALGAAARLEAVTVSQIGPDILVEGDVVEAAAG
jgi:diaminohydroxyphosphoribosylaminopyrimidine deaminase/5-amino-6-(5-phosphoribosylamino)uracil reductase